MSPAHLDRLSATDASFLSQESDNAHMHIGAVLVFEGPPPTYDEFVEHIEARLHLVPRFRQKLAFPPLPIREAGVGRRPAAEPRVPRPTLVAPGSRGRRPARDADRQAVLPAAGPFQAAVGDVPRAGAGGQPLRADQQDAPCARGRDLRGGPGHRALRRQPRAGRARASGAAVGAEAGAERRGAARAQHRERREGAAAARPPPRAGRTASAPRRSSR